MNLMVSIVTEDRVIYMINKCKDEGHNARETFYRVRLTNPGFDDGRIRELISQNGID